MQQILIVCNSCSLQQLQSDGKYNYDVSQLFQNCDMALFKWLLGVNHCLHDLYPDKRHRAYRMILRPHGHNLSLSKCRLQSTRNSCINTILFKLYMYICKSERLTLLN